MQKIFKLLFWVTVLFSSGPLLAQPIQRHNVFSYNVNEGLLQSNVLDMAFDLNNYCWLAFANGIQRFDGKNFIQVPIQKGLPDDKWVQFFQSQNGDVLISHIFGISKYDINSEKFNLVFAYPNPFMNTSSFIGEDNNTIFIYTEKGAIIGLDANTYKERTRFTSNVTEFSSDFSNRPKISDNIINHKVAFLANDTIYLCDLQNQKIIKKATAVKDISNFFLRLKNEDEVLFCSTENNIGFNLYNFKTGKTRLLQEKTNVKGLTFRSVVYSWQGKTLVSMFSSVYETDPNLEEIRSELVNYQNQPIAGKGVIVKIKEDHFGNLYLISITEGFKKILKNNYPIKYFGSPKQELNYCISLLADKPNNRIFLGSSSNGLIIYDTLQQFIKHIPILPGTTSPFSPSTIIKLKDEDYMIFTSSFYCIWRLSKDLKTLTPVPITNSQPNMGGVGYFTKTMFHSDEKFVIHSQGWLLKSEYPFNQATEHRITNVGTMSNVFYNGKMIIPFNDNLVCIDPESFQITGRFPLKNTGGVRCFTEGRDNNLYVGSNKGIFVLDSNLKLLWHLDKQKGLPDECIYSMEMDKNNILWCSSNKGIFKIRPDRSILHLKKENGLQENEFNTNVSTITPDGEVFFGGINGISSFYPSTINPYSDQIKIFLTSIKVNNEDLAIDTSLWKVEKIELPYSRNSLAIDYIAMGPDNPDQYVYQYKMQGVDNEWITNDDMQSTRYLLQPGRYVFQVYASRLFDKDALPLKELVIIIHPPFWKTWWFVIAVILLTGMILAININRFNKKKYAKKLRALESEQQLKLERERISRDLHDSLGAYANAVLYNTELLQQEINSGKREELIKDLRFASKDIITSLRETIWALNKENFTVKDCLVRIRNFIQPFNRYYNHIQFRVEGDAPDYLVLHATKALHLVRIIQEAVSNSIKHADAKNIVVTSSEENGNWKLVVMDDGKGFDFETTKKQERGNGLSNMEQRTNDAGFNMIMESIPGIGTTIRIIISPSSGLKKPI